MNCLYTIPLCNFGFAFRHATCVIVEDFGKALLKNQILPDFLFIQTIRTETVIWNCPMFNNIDCGLMGYAILSHLSFDEHHLTCWYR